MSHLTFVEVPIDRFGIDLGLTFVLIADGRIAIEMNHMFVPTYDYSETGVTACFDRDGFSLLEPGGDFQGYAYGAAYKYKDMPVLNKWLVQQQMELT